jgi:hypothetical protein
MSKTMIVAATALVLHGLIHLMGTGVYLKLTSIEALPYKTALLGGIWEIGVPGIRIFGLLWGVAALGFIAAVVGLATDAGWTQPLLLGTTLLSLMLTVLDWNSAWAGVIINVIILVGLMLWPRIIE